MKIERLEAGILCHASLRKSVIVPVKLDMHRNLVWCRFEMQTKESG
jgi:hypothetical protein